MGDPTHVIGTYQVIEPRPGPSKTVTLMEVITPAMHAANRPAQTLYFRRDRFVAEFFDSQSFYTISIVKRKRPRPPEPGGEAA